MAAFARHLNPFNRKRKPPVAYWSGIVDVGPEGASCATPCPTTSTDACASSRSAPARAGWACRSRHRSEGRFHPDAERAGDGGARRRVHRQRRRLQQHRRRERPDSRGRAGKPGLSLQGPASVDLQIAEKKEGVGEFRIKANAVLGAGLAEIRRAPRIGRGAHRRKRERAAGGGVSDAADAGTRRWQLSHGASHARHVQRAAEGRGRGLDAAAGLGTGA